MKVETLKTAIRPLLAIWAIVMFTLLALGMVDADWSLRALWVACIIQWIPDRAIKRLKEAWGHG